MNTIGIIIFLVLIIIVMSIVIIINQIQKSKQVSGTFFVNAEDDTLTISIDNSTFTNETITSMKYLVLENQLYAERKGTK